MSVPEASPAAFDVSNFWGLTVFFNPGRSRRRKAVYDIFRANSARQGLRLLAVELAFGSDPFELQAGDAEILIPIRAGSDAVMWQKERLLNIGLEHLPAACGAFAWLDCDVIFDNARWVEETVRLLCRYAVVQPYSLAARLPRGETSMNIRLAARPEHDRRPGCGYAYTYGQASPLEDPLRSGHTGFAWAARRSLFDGIGFHDRMIAGGGEVILASGLLGRFTNPLTHLLPDALMEHQRKWIETISGRVGGSVTYTRGGLLHLWHGTSPGDELTPALRGLRRHSFDPRHDISESDSGCFGLGRKQAPTGAGRRTPLPVRKRRRQPAWRADCLPARPCKAACEAAAGWLVPANLSG